MKPDWQGPREKKMFQRLQKICLALPGAVEGVAWRQPVFRVNDSIFASFAPGHGGLHIAFRAKSREVLDDPQVKVAPMGERQGWVLRMIGDDEDAASMDWKKDSRMRKIPSPPPPRTSSNPKISRLDSRRPVATPSMPPRSTHTPRPTRDRRG